MRLGSFKSSLVLLGALALTFALLTAGCKRKLSPEEAIERVLKQGVSALEDGDVKAAGELLSDDYRDRAGRDRRSKERASSLQ